MELRHGILQTDPSSCVRGNAKQIQEKTLDLGISIEGSDDNILEVWMEKAKGMKQIIFERGFLDLENLKLYTKDFVEEKTVRQHTLIAPQKVILKLQ
eukprot:5204866-Ditylum_brightwellii.AAC.1